MREQPDAGPTARRRYCISASASVAPRFDIGVVFESGAGAVAVVGASAGAVAAVGTGAGAVAASGSAVELPCVSLPSHLQKSLGQSGDTGAPQLATHQVVSAAAPETPTQVAAAFCPFAAFS